MTFKIWLTQGQGNGEFPTAECDTIEEAIDEAQSMWGEGCISIEKPDGTWHKFEGREWRMSPTIVLLRLRKDPLNPRQQHLLKKLKNPKFGREMRRVMREIRECALCPDRLLDYMVEAIGNRTTALKLFLECLTWGLFESFEWSSCAPYPK